VKNGFVLVAIRAPYAPVPYLTLGFTGKGDL